MATKTTASVVVWHRRTNRAYSYNEDFEILESLILDPAIPGYKTIRQYWKPMTPNVPAWAMGVRDLEFDTYFL